MPTKHFAAIQDLTTETLLDFDEGRFAASVDMTLEKITADICDRPGLQKPRMLELKLLIVPAIDTDGTVGIKAAYQCTPKLPPIVSNPVSCRLSADGKHMQFRGCSADNLDQMRLPMESPDTEVFDPPQDEF